MTHKESRREAKRRSVVANIQSKISYMKKKSEENKVSAEQIGVLMGGGVDQQGASA